MSVSSSSSLLGYLECKPRKRRPKIDKCITETRVVFDRFKITMDSCGNPVLRCGDPQPFNAESNSWDKISKPIRVIAVRRTVIDKRCIYFSRPLDWDFHVLSHTWSESVRALSRRIGLRIATVNSDGDQDAYSRAFEEEDCSEYPCYKPLLELFKLLMGDGVERIWFDALCINQHDIDEKSLEISNMGSYYSLSKGCYVLTHGVGEGYELWSNGVSDGGSVLPRWFSRVWTFQEFLLPRRLCFIVEGVDERFVAVVNQLISEKSRMGLCRCFLKMADLDQIFLSSLNSEDLKWMGGFELRDENWKSITELMDERAKFDKWGVGPTCDREPLSFCNGCYHAKTDKLYRRDLLQEKSQMQNDSRLPELQQRKLIASSDTICTMCCSKPMIRKCETSAAAGSPTIYLVDREAYLALMQCHSRMVEKPTEVNPSAGIQALRGLYCAWAMEGNWRPCHVICEVGWRDCSNEEDRVQSILGLLGLRLHQLRTGKTLESQVMELTKAGGSEMLIELCMVNQKGGKKVGFSWAPDFDGANKKLEYALRPKHVYMEVERLGEDYRLQLKAKVVSGKVLPLYKQADASRITEEASHCLVIPLQKSDEAIRITLDLTTISSSQNLILHFNINYVYHHALLGSFEVPLNISNAQHLDLSKVSFPIRFVLLGRDEIESKLILLCMVKESTKPEELHKIGSIALKDAAMGDLHSTLESCNMQECVLGGFGADLDDYIHV